MSNDPSENKKYVRDNLPILVCFVSGPECTNDRLGPSGATSSSTSFALNCEATVRNRSIRESSSCSPPICCEREANCSNNDVTIGHEASVLGSDISCSSIAVFS